MLSDYQSVFNDFKGAKWCKMWTKQASRRIEVIMDLRFYFQFQIKLKQNLSPNQMTLIFVIQLKMKEYISFYLINKVIHCQPIKKKYTLSTFFESVAFA